MVTEKQLLSALGMVGVVLDPWQMNLIRVSGLFDFATDDDSTPVTETPQWKRYAMRRLARQWHTEARLMVSRGVYDESLSHEEWEYLAREAKILRKCADRLLEEAK